MIFVATLTDHMVSVLFITNVRQPTRLIARICKGCLPEPSNKQWRRQGG